MLRRSSGILLHPTSLPGRFGIGAIGPQAHRWIDFLSQAGCSLWQMLPLGPTGYGDSPYQCFSAFAGNPYLISPDALVEDGLLTSTDLDSPPDFPPTKVDYGKVIPWKLTLLHRAFERFSNLHLAVYKHEFDAFRQTQAEWLEDFALFMALKESHNNAVWNTWNQDLRDREPEALNSARQSLNKEIERHIFWQFLFKRQWDEVRKQARSNKITLIGDAPIFVAYDSADVWANQGLFHLDRNKNPKYIAGVPPDYFSPTGQLWGNPLYCWEAHKADGYRWWINRLKSVLNQVDLVRLDHFIGFVRYWMVRGSARTAEKGHWAKGPGKSFLKAIKAALGSLPLIAEDLGAITPEVIELRDSFGLPGMKILQFAFGSGPKNPFLPHNYPNQCVVYTGTHDNDTTLGWYERVSEDERAFYRRYLDRDGSDVSWDLIRACWASVAAYALAPMQDFLALGNQARMNYPGRPDGNWGWRLSADDLSQELCGRINQLNTTYDRLKV